jgi:hypothetical protein
LEEAYFIVEEKAQTLGSQKAAGAIKGENEKRKCACQQHDRTDFGSRRAGQAGTQKTGGGTDSDGAGVSGRFVGQ